MIGFKRRAHTWRGSAPCIQARSTVKFHGPPFAILLLALTAIPWGAAEADIFRCQAPDGNMSYSDSPCPRAAIRSANITTAVGACSTSECTAQREQAAGYARERLRSEQEWLAGLTEKRLRAELDDATERARLDELGWRQSVEARLAVAANEPGYAAGYPDYYPYLPSLSGRQALRLALRRTAATTAPRRRSSQTHLGRCCARRPPLAVREAIAAR